MISNYGEGRLSIQQGRQYFFNPVCSYHQQFQILFKQLVCSDSSWFCVLDVMSTFELINIIL